MIFIMEVKKILDVRIDDVSITEALEKARSFLVSGQNKIFTPNPEMLVKAQKDEYFKKVLNSGDLNLCDGFGLWLAVRCASSCHSERSEESLKVGEKGSFATLRMTKKTERITGIDFMLELCALAEKENRSIYLLGSGSDEITKQCAEVLNKKFVHLKIAGYDRGPMIEENSMLTAENGSTIDKINTANPDILFVAFGMGKQEKWIYENLAKMPSVRIAMGVGGSFDYIAGAVPRAPLFLRKIGLEWMYRLARQPKRAGRIFNATFKFVYLILCHRS